MASFLPRSVADIHKIPPSVYRNLFVEYLELRALRDVTALLLDSARLEDHTSLFISAQDLIDFDPTLGHSLIHFPRLLLPVLKAAVIDVQGSLHRHPKFELKYKTKGTIKKQVNMRVINIPPLPEINKHTISDIRANDFEQFIQLTGTVVRTGSVRVLEVSKEYQCTRARCGYKFTVLADPEQNNNIPVPRACPAPKAAPGVGVCGAGNIEEVPGSRECVDYQEIRIQDKMELLHLGCVPRTITIVLEADLADRFNAGDDVIVIGNIVRRWSPVCKGARCHIELAVRANSVQVLNSNEEFKMLHRDHLSRFKVLWEEYNDIGRPYTCRDEIIRAVCPQLHGMYFVKMCLLLTIIGGSARSSNERNNNEIDANHHPDSLPAGGSSAVSRRSQSHLLIVGDPGTGKSQLLRFAASLLPRSVLTTGVGTTGAGLTCTAVRDGNDWVLEAGALVLANEGVCCIDEFVSIKEQDRACIHEAMEQQTISVAKAGLLVKLNTRATVIAVSNPKGSYDVNSDLTTNTAIASPLLSRFDLVLVLLDYPEKEYDKRISTFLLQQAVGVPIPCRIAESVDGKSFSSASFWNMEMLRAYVLYSRENLFPKMGEGARFLLMRYYQMQRQSDDRSTARTTVRLLESLMRLAEAHAKLMFREDVLLQDAVMAITCVELSASATVVFQGVNSALHADFPLNPEDAYDKMEVEIFKKLHYSRERLDEDIGTKGSVSISPPIDIKSRKRNMCPNAAEADQFMQFELVSSKNRRVDDTAAINVTVIDVGFLSDCRDEGMTNSQSSILNRTIAGQNKSASCCYDGEKNGLSFFSQNSHTISSEISIQEKMQGLPANMNERDAAKFPSSILIQSSECSRSFPIKKGNEKQFSNVQQQSATGNNKHFFSGSEMGEAVAMNSASLLFSSIFNNSDDGRGVVDILKSNSNQDEEEW